MEIPYNGWALTAQHLKNINEMLDAAIVAYKKQLDSLFANQALDIETDIAVMNAMLDREGLSDKKDFNIREEPKGAVATSSQTATRYMWGT